MVSSSFVRSFGGMSTCLLFAALHLSSPVKYVLSLTASLIIAVFIGLTSGSLEVDESGATADALVAALLGPDSQIHTSNAQVSFHNCKGFFSNGLDVFPSFPASGVILSTGSPEDALGPDDTESETTTFLTSGDEDLTKQAGAATQDACFLTFDMTCQNTEGCQFFLTYVFASEEYQEFVEEGAFLDPIGIFLNGRNLAVLPGTNPPVPVAIDTVNGQDNNQFFIENSDVPDESIDLQPDGFTTTLTAQGLANFGSNSVKVVVADLVDPSLDSFLFLKGGSLGFQEPQGHASSSGDPHFLRWKHTKRDSFQGECDLVLLHNKAFLNGLGLDVHIRKTIRDAYSYIEEVAVRVGDHVLEVHKDDVFYNSKSLPQEAHPFSFGDGFRTEITQDTGRKGKQQHTVQLGGTKITIKHSKAFMAVDIAGGADDLTGSVGILGTYEGGVMLGRTGQVFDDFDAFGFEWQVNPVKDPVLFKEARSPQLPNAQCIMPEQSSDSGNSGGGLTQKQRCNLRDSSSPDFIKKAKKKCRKLQPENFKLCVDDILASGDLSLASTW